MPLNEWREHAELTRGRHGLPVDSVRRAQRGRLLTATAELATEHGVRGVTAARLTDRAGVSRATLYSLFPNKEACVQAAADEALALMLAAVSAAAAPSRPPEVQLETMVDRFTGFCADHPKAARLGIVEIAGSGPTGAALRDQALDDLTEVLGKPLAGLRPDAPLLTAELFAGGLWHVAGTRLRAGRADELPLAGKLIRIRWLEALRAGAR
jgi:AcrR family transcriptional regulator